MSDLSSEEEKKILESSPKGTMALLMIFAIATVLGWLYMYFGMFLQHGPVN
jgi:hypothetical protein